MLFSDSRSIGKIQKGVSVEAALWTTSFREGKKINL